MKKNHLFTGIKKATIELILLKLLNEQDMYGYQLTQEVKKRSNGTYTVLEGSMYPILYRLSDLGIISYYEKKVGIRKTRVYYHLEESGKEYLRDLLKDYKEAIAMIDFILNSAEGEVFDESEK